MEMNNNVDNGGAVSDVSAIGSGGPGELNLRKQREIRLKKRVKSPIAIKIEDDSDDETVAPAQQNGCVAERVDKGVQTENVLLVEALRTIVHERMQQYQAAALKDQNIDTQLSPLLEKLQKENDELRKQGMALRAQLDFKEKEKQTLKRRYGAIENALISKSAPVTSPSKPPPPYTATTGIAVPNRSPNPIATLPRPPVPNSSAVAPRMAPPRPIRPPPLHPSNSSFSQPGSTNQTTFQQPATNQPRPLVHMVNPVRHMPSTQHIQPIMRHPYAPNERFVLVNNQFLPASVNGINTQVVATNHGLRMTPMPPDMTAIRPPIDTPARPFHNVPPNVAANEQYKQLLQRMPNGIVHPQLRPVQNTVRPFNQTIPQQGQPAVQNLPNIATTFASLPKLTANISTSNNAIVLTWDYEKTVENTEQYKVECYQLFAHQAKDSRVKPPTDTKLWKKIGVVNALPLPMACTLTQFASGSVYFFAVVAVDIHGREGEMSNPCVIRLDVNR